MYDIVIIGAGPAGMTAALYALRAGKKVLVIEKETFGGQITFSPHVENYPGMKSMSGNEFSDSLLDQILEHGAETEFDEVTGIDVSDKIKKVFCGEKVYEAKAIIIATGAKHRELGVEGEKELVGRGVSYCAVCDGAFFKGKVVAVAGGGNTALQDAIYLADGCEKVYLVHRRDEFRGDKRLVDKLKTLNNVEFVISSTIEKLDSNENGLQGIYVKTRDGIERNISVSGLFVAVGQEPSNGFLGEKISLDSAGYVDANENCLTNVEGVFVAGDCRHKSVRQLTTAVGDGACAAVAACEYID